MLIALFEGRRPPTAKVNWYMFKHIESHNTWKGVCPEISIYRDAGNGNTYYPHYYKVKALGKTKYFYGEMAESQLNRYLFDLGIDSTI